MNETVTLSLLSKARRCGSAAGVRLGHVGAAGLGLLICTSGPSQVWTAHIVHGTLSFSYWSFLYPFVAVAIFGIVALARHLRQVQPSNLSGAVYALGAFVVWALASSAWSVAPTDTPQKMLVNTGISAFGCWIGLALSFREVLVAVNVAMGAAVLASATVIYGRPGIGISIYGDYQGIFGNPNSLGPVCVLCILALFGLVLEFRRKAVVAIALSLGLLASSLLLGSHSDTALVALVLSGSSAVLIPSLWWLRKHKISGMAVAVVFLAGCVGAWILLFRFLSPILRFFNKDITLSQRRYIWDDVRDNISRRPWHGYGFGAFWENVNMTSYTYLRIGRPYGSAHDSILEITLGLGFIGLFLFLWAVAVGFSGVFRAVWFGRSVSTWWWTILLVFVVAVNLTESFVLWYSYVWVLLVATIVVSGGRALLPSERTTLADSQRTP